MNPQDSQSELERMAMDCLVIARSFKGEGRRELQELFPVHKDLLNFIEAYVTTRVKEAERLARIDENKIWQDLLVARMELDRYSPNSIHVIDFEKRIEALTTTTNGKEE